MAFSLFRTPSSAPSDPHTVELEAILKDPAVSRAFRYLENSTRETTRELITINEIPAPPFKEQERAQFVCQRFQEMGLQQVHQDLEGNILGILPGRSDPAGTGPLIALAAHIDSVFPEGTDVSVRLEHGRFFGPGLGDNGSGLAGLLALVRCFTQVPLSTEHSLIFVGTVGEEGPGNLRGVRHLFLQNPCGRNITEFIALDGPGIERITHQALGSRRFEVKFEGPGGHSWGDFGIVNPVHALGRFIYQMTSCQLPPLPRTTCTIGVIEGGTSVNTIPGWARCEVDLRSTSETELDRLEGHLRTAAQLAAQEEERASLHAHIRLKSLITSMGNRPSGITPVDSRLVRLALEATRLRGAKPLLDCASTDSNLPISLGIPAITIGAGGRCGGCHTLDEWYDPTGRETSLQRTLLLVLGLAGLAA
ncbi:MAG: M20/M25/M40 family metallo-hydrolase [Blastocatellia bacterium]|nr:M20/M25/M40 family metallo-hydrolase [Blastocatellia bacterium]